MAAVATLLIIAGSDSGGGAGIQADLKTASALGVYGATAITAITAQNTMGVRAVAPLAPDMVAAQIRAVLDDIRVDAVKIGMLATADIVAATAGALQDYAGPVVLDPVMVAKSGDALLDAPAVSALREELLPRATMLTPNLPEAARLLGREATDPAETRGAALRALGPETVLVKGGHADGPICRDVLVTGAGALAFEAPRLTTRNTHGTGCSLASAIAAEMAKGADPEAAVGRAHGWLHAAIRAADRLGVGHGHGPVHHFHEVWA
ncbi:bifunctional hydroxymethylpyrimidine kinase/phosphomethylpyrimidine kinase [Psychromarinibacter sp. C21-152]|uniref:hydroxymethylpyrimidine kinase n=1 Tax=Psychromarinibacter sediminicola TaxID=3033385 RepID=A0AAE3T8Z2_9RHOB|nr:bifunctional hydroxymethylpyrimidine kinase/phosphomethylpyrimidine kinase [Psychromarinibacter sediminicola]MDF0600549.1 bifunctional hydroxymethylpyrimidine kinase/phosphomethylpyrimidine kinase [Psychromarinibacter sediminicola]